MRMRKTLIWALALSCALACSEPMMAAFGSNSEITIVTTSRSEGPARKLAASLEREVVTVQYEKAYTVTLVTTGDLKNQNSRKNIVVIDYLEPPDNLSKAILDLAASAKDELMEGKSNMFHRDDRWARGQVVVGITAPTAAELDEFVTGKSDEIFDYIADVVQARLNRSLFLAGEQELVTQRLAETYGWSLRLPPRYEVDEKYAAERVIKILNDRPARMITVYWEDGDWESPETTCLDRKKMLAWKYWDEDEIVDGTLEVDKGDFVGMPAVHLTGNWENKKYVIGGTFTTYCFTCTKCGRHYVVDAAVFAPGLEKLPLMRELEAILVTFKCTCSP
jgi:hypothetical protein